MKVQKQEQNLKIRDQLSVLNEIRNHIRVDPLLSTEWRQKDPFNRLSPMVDGVRAPAGCVSVAIGQIVNYYKTLTTKNIDWNKIANEDGDEQAKLIRTIGDEIRMSYHKEYTHPQINIAGLDFFSYRDRVTNFLNANGYNTNGGFLTTMKVTKFGAGAEKQLYEVCLQMTNRCEFTKCCFFISIGVGMVKITHGTEFLNLIWTIAKTRGDFI
jgi:hypothetical protein